MVALNDIREPLQFLLIELGACDAAVRWAKGKGLNREIWDDAPRDYQKWIAVRLGCEQSAEAVSEAIAIHGYGDGYGDGSARRDHPAGAGYGGFASGDGIFHEFADGSGYGSGE